MCTGQVNIGTDQHKMAGTDITLSPLTLSLQSTIHEVTELVHQLQVCQTWCSISTKLNKMSYSVLLITGTYPQCEHA